MANAVAGSSARPMLPLGSSSALFERPGCPACRYVAQNVRAYLGWLALDGCRDAGELNRLSASRGLCAGHTARLLAVTGSVAPLAAAYGHVIGAAIADVAAGVANCPACEHASAAEDRLLGYLLDEATRGDRQTYKKHGGLCLPHLRHAAVVRRGTDVLWIVRFMIVRLTAPSPSLELLAGDVDAAAWAPGRRLALESGPSTDDPASCTVCWAGARAEQIRADEAPDDCLCAHHLRDRVTAAINGGSDLLARQASLHAARLAQVLDRQARRLGNYLPVRARRALAEPDCPACRSRDAARNREVARLAAALERRVSGASPPPVAVCVRHAHDMHAIDERAGNLAARYLTARGQRLLGQLAAAAENDAPASQVGLLSPRTGPLWQAAAFLDGLIAVRGRQPDAL